MTPMNGNYVKMKKRHKNKCKLINIEKNEVKYEDLFTGTAKQKIKVAKCF